MDSVGQQSCFRTFCLGANFLPIYEKKNTLSVTLVISLTWQYDRFQLVAAQGHNKVDI